jgi:AcrR family transcriptional regulator
MTPTTERREREKLAVRTKILDAARELFAEHGYEAVTMRMIAERIEYTPTAIYYHFADKDALIRELVDQDYLALAHDFQRIAGITDPVARLQATGVAYAEFAFAHPNHYRLMFMTPNPPPDTCDPKQQRRGNPKEDAYAFLRWTIGEVVAAGRIQPHLQNVDLASQLAWAGLHGVIALLLDHQTDPWVDWRPAGELATAMLDVVMRGLLIENHDG